MKGPKVKGPSLGRCFRPKQCWVAPELTPAGNKKLVFKLPYMAEWSPTEKARYTEMAVPCGQCLSCRVTKAAMWSFRVMSEARDHRDNCWITLTYDQEHLPLHGSLNRGDPTNFFKRLRHHLGDVKVRYFGCGEYGDKRERPHYHICLFGYYPDDLVAYDRTRRGEPLYRSPFLEKVWGNGLVQVSDLTAYNAAYTARYSLKKVVGKFADRVDPGTGLKPYERIDTFTGEIVEVAPEFMMCSTNPGIGKSFFDKFFSDVFPRGTVVHKGREVPAPEYFWQLLRKENPELYDALKVERTKLAKAAADHPDNSERRLAEREKYAESAYKDSRKRSFPSSRSPRS